MSTYSRLTICGYIADTSYGCHVIIIASMFANDNVSVLYEIVKSAFIKAHRNNRYGFQKHPNKIH